MQHLPALGAGICVVTLAFLFRAPTPSNEPAANRPAVVPAVVPAVASGHDVLVVEGDRDALTITHVAHKADPWAGVPKDLQLAHAPDADPAPTTWRLAIRDAKGDMLCEVPLDVSLFATDANAKGSGLRVQGCMVLDSRIAMLVNAPSFAAAASYEFWRHGTDGTRTSVGRIAATDVRRMAGEVR